MRVAVWDPIDRGHHRRYLDALSAYAPDAWLVRYPPWYEPAGARLPGPPDVVLALDAHRLPRLVWRIPGAGRVSWCVVDLRGTLGAVRKPGAYRSAGVKGFGTAMAELAIREAACRAFDFRFVYLSDWAACTGTRRLRHSSRCVGDLIDSPTTHATPPAGLRTPGRLTIALLGVMAPRKGLDLLVEAVERLPPESRVQFHIFVGGAPVPGYSGRYRELVRALGRLEGLSCSVLARHLGQDEFYGAIHGADTIVVPYRQHHGASGILGSALSAGTPVIVSDFGWPGELGRRNGCVVFQDGNACSLAAKIAEIPCADRAKAYRPAGYVDDREFAEAIWDAVGSSLGASLRVTDSPRERGRRTSRP